MYYEVYVDILFLENLWMDAELLILTAKLFRKPLHAGRILAAAIVGSLGACLLTIGSEWISRAGCFLGSLFLAVLMTAIAFGREKHFRLTVAGLYLECFLMGGFLRYADQFYRLNGMVFLMAGSVAGVVLSGLETLILEKKKEEQRVCRTVLVCGSCQLGTGRTSGYRERTYRSCQQKSGESCGPCLYGTFVERGQDRENSADDSLSDDFTERNSDSLPD